MYTGTDELPFEHTFTNATLLLCPSLNLLLFLSSCVFGITVIGICILFRFCNVTYLRMKSVVYCIIFSANKIWIKMQPPTLRTLCQPPSPSQMAITEPAAMPEPMPEPYIILEPDLNMPDQMRELATLSITACSWDVYLFRFGQGGRS